MATRTTASRQSTILSGCVAEERRILFSRRTHFGGWSLIQNLHGISHENATLIEATPEFRIYKLTVR